jgi:HEAT repeat protein
MNKKPGFRFSGGLLTAMALLLPLAAAANVEPGGDVYQELLSFEYGQSREAFWRVENQIRQAGPQEKLEIQRRLLDALQDPRGTAAARQSICATVLMIGSCDSIPILQTLLADPKVSDAARGALQGLPCPAVDRVFREAALTNGGQIRLSLIASIGERRDREAVQLLEDLLKTSDVATTRAVLAALGRIGGEPAVRVLRSATVPPSLDSARMDAYLSGAASLVSEGRPDQAKTIYRELLQAKNGVVGAAALTGLVKIEKEAALDHVLAGLQSPHQQVRQAAAALVVEIPGPAATARIVELVPGLPPATQVPVLAALGDRKGVEALPVLLRLWADGDEAVRVAAGQALGKVGDRTCVEPLIKNATLPGVIGATAQESLRMLVGSGVDEAIALYLGDSDAVLRVTALRNLTARRYAGTPPLAFARLADPDAVVRIESWRSLAVFGKPQDLPRMIDLLIKLEESREQQAAEQAIQGVAEPMPRDQAAQLLLDAMAGATSRQRCSLLRTLGRIGGERAFASIREATRDREAEVQDTAIRVLSDWGDNSAQDDLLRLAKQGKKENHRILGLRGYVRLAGTGRHDDEDRVRMYKTALSAASRADEKKLVLGATGSVPSASALELVEPYLTDKTLKTEAQAAYFKIAGAVAAQDPGRASVALRKLIKVAGDPELKARAEEALQRLVN